jgi:hypothetical protein
MAVGKVRAVKAELNRPGQALKFLSGTGVRVA